METPYSDPAFLDAGLRECREITRRYATNYYFATQFFPAETRLGIYGIYAFARIPDEIMDDPAATDRAAAREKLAAWRDRWLEAMEKGGSGDALMNAIVHTFRKFRIPVEDGEAFLRSMFIDEEKREYADYAELEDYMYGSAGVIGHMVTRIVGFSSDDAFPYARKLGYAFQLTNFLRDIREDHDELGRIYLPQDDLRRFGLSSADIAGRVHDERFVRLMKFQIERNRRIYREALPGIKMLHWRGRLAVRVSFVLYQAILRQVERANYNIYNGRVRTNAAQKVWLATKAMVGVYE